jgi:hypothetical protein
MAISKSKRFEVFKRDKFTCQYCGKSAPNVLVELDHIVPRAEGGSDDILNLITSCTDCNRGKGARRLSDDTVVAKQRKQLEELETRREQLEMMIDWQRSVMDMEDYAIEELAAVWDELVPGYKLNERGIRTLTRWMREFEIPELVECMKISTAQYLRYDGEEAEMPTHRSVDKAWDYVPKIARRRRSQQEKPYLTDLFYIVYGILNKNFAGHVETREAIDLMEEAYLSGVTILELKRVASGASSYWAFTETMKDLVRARQAN